jgi:hypothetical protein
MSKREEKQRSEIVTESFSVSSFAFCVFSDLTTMCLWNMLKENRMDKYSTP